MPLQRQSLGGVTKLKLSNMKRLIVKQLRRVINAAAAAAAADTVVTAAAGRSVVLLCDHHCVMCIVLCFMSCATAVQSVLCPAA
jgi:hypothetical protein